MKNKYWLDLKQKEGKKSSKNEFLNPLPDEKKMQSSRRDFLKLMGAGIALAGTGCVRRPAEKLVPYINRPEDVIPGEANYYASSFYDGSEGLSTVIKTREGRPIKIQGNEQASLLNGEGLSARAHSYILSLYDPERVKGPKENLFNSTKTNKETINATYKKMDKKIVNELKKGKVALLTPRIPSPSTQEVMRAFRNTYSVKNYVWDPLTFEDKKEADRLSFGARSLASFDISKAQFLFSLNSDFLETGPQATELKTQFAKSRKGKEGKMSKLVVLESLMTLTGANADERWKISPQDQLPALLNLIEALGKKGLVIPSPLKNFVKKNKKPLLISDKKWEEWADLLLKHKGESLIVFGGGLSSKTKDSLTLHILTNFLNSALGNDGRTINYKESFTYEFGSYKQMENLIRDINQGRIKSLIIHGLNPVYSYFDSEKFLKALRKVFVVYTGDRVDETGFYSDFLVPDHHPLEKWGDWEFKKSVFTIQQPGIRPLYNTRAFEDSLISWINLSGNSFPSKNFYEHVRKTWSVKKGSLFWRPFLKKGVSAPSRLTRLAPRPFKEEAFSFLKSSSLKPGYALSLYETSSFKEGSLSNVPWLMEFPDPVTKICWENYVSLSPKTASKEKLKEGEIIKLKIGEKSLDIPVHIQPGHHDEVFSLAVGFGRKMAGSIGNGKGKNAFPLIQFEKGFVSSSLPVEFEKTGKKTRLANVQSHHSMEGREIVLETTFEEFKKDPSSGIPHHHKVPSLWSKHKYKGHKWGMVIDLNSCTGCGSCMLACQSENNIPTVGKEYVLEGREMHWIRIDRYYKGEADNPQAVHQPVVCMHCDNAPCESVCPVLATVHSSEGTNDMVYNRCVGTRYCSNNCPYKVRRFNWFDYTHKVKDEPVNLVLNPEVTVRNRGVMEKCSFCIQRIEQGKARAKKEDRPLKDGDIKTACQESCPSQAIVFGDLNDKTSKVAADV